MTLIVGVVIFAVSIMIASAASKQNFFGKGHINQALFPVLYAPRQKTGCFF